MVAEDVAVEAVVVPHLPRVGALEPRLELVEHAGHRRVDPQRAPRPAPKVDVGARVHRDADHAALADRALLQVELRHLRVARVHQPVVVVQDPRDVARRRHVEHLVHQGLRRRRRRGGRRLVGHERRRRLVVGHGGGRRELRRRRHRRGRHLARRAGALLHRDERPVEARARRREAEDVGAAEHEAVRAAHRDEDEDGAQAAPSPAPVTHQAIAVFACGAGRFASFAGRSRRCGLWRHLGAKLRGALAPCRAPEPPRRRRAPSRSSPATVPSAHTASSPHTWTSSPSSSPSLPTGRPARS